MRRMKTRKYKSNDEIADRLVLLLSNADSASDESEAMGRVHAIGRHVELHRDQIIVALRKKANY